MAGLPAVQKIKMEAFKAAEAEGRPAPVATKPNAPTAVVSMVPGQRPPANREPAPIDPNDFAVERVPSDPAAPPVASEQPPAPRPGDEPPASKNWEEEADINYRRWKSVSGLYEKTKSDLEATSGKLRELEQQIAELKNRPAPQPTQPAMPAKDLAELLEGADKTNYSEAVPAIAKIATAIAERMIAERLGPIEAKVGEVETNTGNLTKNQVVNEENAFISRVRDKFPNLDTLVNEAGWATHRDQRIPFSDMTYGQALIEAHKQRNYERVVEILSSYKAPPKPKIEDLATPAVRRDGSDPTRRTGQKPILKISERTKASEDFRKGRITKERMDQITTLYKEAEAEGRIDFKA